MRSFAQRLDNRAEDVLRAIIGKLNVGFYFPEAWVAVHREGVSVSSVSIPVGKNSFVILEVGWSDTLEDFLDIYELRVSTAEKPKDIFVIRDENGPSGWAFDHVSTINTWDWTIVEKISIYEKESVGKHESVICDEALLFQYGKGQILISAGGTQFDRLEVNHKPDVIESRLAPLKLRNEIG